jgi:hypothetical protein
MINWEKCGEDRSWCSWRQYVGIGPEELRKTTTKLSLVGVRAEIPTGRLVEELSDTAGTRYRKSHFATSRRPASFQAPVVWFVVFEKSTSIHSFFKSGLHKSRATKFCKTALAPSVCLSACSVDWLHIVLRAPRILRCLLDFCKACGPLFELKVFRVRIRILKSSKCDQNYQLSRMKSEVFFALKIHVVDGWITTSCRTLTDAHKTCCFTEDGGSIFQRNQITIPNTQ